MKKSDSPFDSNCQILKKKPIVLSTMHRQKVFAYLYSFIGDKELCSDLTQEALLCAYSKSVEGTYDERGLALPWLKKIALCKANDYFRNTGRRRRLVEANAPSVILGLGLDANDEAKIPLDYAIHKGGSSKEQFNDLLDLIPEKQRMAIHLHYFENCTMEEAARRLKTNKNTITGRCRLGLKKLKKVADEKGFPLNDLLRSI